MLKPYGLYDPFYEHDSCGVGFVADIAGKRSHAIVEDGITILKNLEHRGAIGGDLKTGDGAGIMIQMPHAFLCKEAARLKFSLPDEGAYGAGMVFLPQESGARKKTQDMIDRVIQDEGGVV
ncbi:MAG: hypothetical protein PHC61_16905, partial [Chitinivibrionales bacterium]|nr:hypothetical protein [Chitinivibrionales bacterium]